MCCLGLGVWRPYPDLPAFEAPCAFYASLPMAICEYVIGTLFFNSIKMVIGQSIRSARILFI